MGDYERKPSKAPTAGPSEDDRFGAGKVGSNLSARIIKYDIVDGRTRITIAQGTTHGARVGMEGYIKSAEGALATFQIDEAKEAFSYAFVDVTPDQLRDAPTVVINPTAKNAPRNPQIKEGESSRVIAVNIVEGKTRITIARGSLHGVKAGMRGTLQGNLGNEGDTFTIEYTSDRVSYAYVKGTLDQVQSHSFVVLHPTASPSRPVQRRASGASTSTSDVQSTAEAGVAGASSRLPFFDTIQRSFGKHDISGVQAQVGGAATQASQALGAQAYATGNRVAFASAPDLHTAAHEAAHTIQQSRGAVGFQGLGAADDEHERHADAVADAVVAGQSAEPLLDQLTGNGTAGAVQRRPDSTKDKMAKVQAGREAMAVVNKVLPTVEPKLQAIQAARETADFHAMSDASAFALNARGVLESRVPALRAALGAAQPSERAAFEKTLAAAESASQRLGAAGDRARTQARRLRDVATGTFVDLPTEKIPATPEETRRRAEQLSPLGLCDDPTMQSSTSRACPLAPDQRHVVRDDVIAGIGGIADNWESAIKDIQLDFRLKPLLEKGGLDPLLSFLIGAAFSWFGGVAIKLLKEQAAKAAAETLEQLATVSVTKFEVSAEEKLLLGIPKKVGDVLGKVPKKGKGTEFFDAVTQIKSLWKQVTTHDVRQLPDPALVALGEGLRTSPFTIEHFRNKLVTLLDNYEAITKIGEVTLLERQATVAVRVLHPTGVVRYALARPAVKVVDNRSPVKSLEPGDDQIEVRDGNYEFESWVDRSLDGFVAEQAKLVLASNDSRWRNKRGGGSNVAALARWHANPHDREDVKMFEVSKNPFVPGKK